MSKPQPRILMPMGTTVWLIDNTSLTFRQIANFVGMHELEVKAVADGEVGVGILGCNPVDAGLLSNDDIRKGEADPDANLAIRDAAVEGVTKTRWRGQKYTPIAKRADKPDAIAWLQRNHPDLNEQQIAKLVGTTRTMIRSVVSRTHWNTPNIKARSPVELGFCSKAELEAELTKIGASAIPAEQEELQRGEAALHAAAHAKETTLDADTTAEAALTPHPLTPPSVLTQPTRAREGDAPPLNPFKAAAISPTPEAHEAPEAHTAITSNQDASKPHP